MVVCRVLPLIAMLLTSAVQAHPESQPASAESHGAHVHGLAKLTVAADAQQLEVMLESPVANFVGFEHLPKTATEQSAWQQHQGVLKTGQWLKLPEQAKCQLQQHQINDPWAQHAHHHADVELSLSYLCQQPAALTEMTVLLFKQAADLHDVAVQWVSGQQQGAASLTADQPVLRFTTTD